MSALYGRVELLALGAEDERQRASQALARGDFLLARIHAKSLLSRAPSSKIGLSLLAEAAEGAGLPEEATLALEPLTEALPWRADPWLRLGRARREAGESEQRVREAFERAAWATEGEAERQEALLELFDLDLRSNDPARASRWLDRAKLPDDPELLLRRAEHALATGAPEVIDLPVEGASLLDGRRALVLGRVLARRGEAAAIDWLLRAFILEADGAEAALSAYVAECRDVVLVSRARAVVGASGSLAKPRWAWAFARAEGRGEDARRALRQGAALGDEAAIRALLDEALLARDGVALASALEASAKAGSSSRDQAREEAARAISEALSRFARGDETAALDALDAIPEGVGAPFRDDLRASWMRGLLPEGSEARWPQILSELQRAARRLSRFDALSRVEALAIERERPLRVAVLGEFNAGKSTFLNALLGEDVAPTGILPTTATLHWLSWAADPFARILVNNRPDRLVALPDLKRALRELPTEEAEVERVLLHAPIELLRRVELLDTPGLNAGEDAHTEAALEAFEAAHFAIWVLDGTQALKDSERVSLEALRRLKIPVWVLVNKRDRLDEGARAQVLDHVREGLLSAGLVSYAEPAFISAKLALAGRLGDEDAYRASGWERVEEGLEAVVSESAMLRERALRRRAKSLLAELLPLARRGREAEIEARAARLSEEARMLEAASRLEGGRARASVVESAREAMRRLEEDLRPLVSLGGLRDASPAASEGARRYAIERAVLRLRPELLAACLREGRLIEVDPRVRSELAGRLDAFIAGAMAVSETPPALDALASAALPLLASVLRERASNHEEAAPLTALEARLVALDDALSREPPPGPSG